MDARLLRYYNEELRYMRELGAEFAREFPKIASRLGMEGLEVTDPYVERLLEGCAFLAARVQLKQDAEFPRLSHRLLELLYPNFLAPVPSMVVVRAQPVPDNNLLSGPTLPRDTPLLAPASAATTTRCQFRTAQPLQLTPLATRSAAYVQNVADLGLSAYPAGDGGERARCSVRLTLQLPETMSVAQLQLDHLRLYLGGQTDVAMQLHELMLSACVGVLVGPAGRSGDARRQWLPASALQPVGYADDEAMLPVTPRGLSGLRLLQENFAFPERFLFVDLVGLKPVLPAIGGSAFEIVLLFKRPGIGLDGVVQADNFQLHCVPAVNLFARRADRIHVDEGHHEFHVVPDRTAPLDYEVYDLQQVTGIDDHGQERSFLPLYAPLHDNPLRGAAYHTLWREPRLMSDHARREGPRSGYIGSEVFIALVDTNEAPYSLDLRQLSLKIRCTNRDLPVFLPAGGSGYVIEGGVPLQSVTAVAGPSRPGSALREGGVAWRLLNLLSLNYLSLLDTEAGEAAAALRDLLSRLPQAGEPAVQRQIESLQRVQMRPVVRRHPAPGPIAFGRGIEVELVVDELGHAGGSAFLFGAALHAHLSRHVSINSFVETVLRSLTRGEVARWKPSPGRRAVI